MITLAIDTSAKTSSAALLKDGKLVGSFAVSCGLTHSETMLYMIDSLLKANSVSIEDVGLAACCAGPGSFTGVRIGVSLIKGLAFGKSCLCAGVSSLLAMAYSLKGMSINAVISPVIDARRETVYNALFELKNGVVTRLTGDRVISASELENEIRERFSDTTVFFPGDGAYLVSENINTALPQQAALSFACGAAFAAEEAYKNGECVESKALSPLYLRPARADVPKSVRNSIL